MSNLFPKFEKDSVKAMRKIKELYKYNQDAEFSFPYNELPHMIQVESHRSGMTISNPTLLDSGIWISSIGGGSVRTKGLIVTYAVLEENQ